MRLRLLAFMILSTLSSLSWAQSKCDPNIDFELGNTSIWNYFIGSVSSGPVLSLSPSPATPTRHDLTSGSGVDPYGNFPVVSPLPGLYSLKLGNDMTGAQAERARYYIHVPTLAGSFGINYWYAVVLQDPSHSVPDQPRFVVTAYDSASGKPIPCAQYNYVASSTLPGFKKSTSGYSVFYKPWSLGSMDLSSSLGTTVVIDFTSMDCTLGGHFGYGYLDMSCGVFSIMNLSCNSDSVTLTAPPGFDVYEWYDSVSWSLIGKADTITIATPPKPTTYAVILTPYLGYGCVDTLYTRIYPSKLTVKPDHDTTVCVSSSIQLRMRAFDIALPLNYTWTGVPGAGILCSSCDSTMVTPALGLNRYAFKVVDAGGCSIEDTINVTAIGVIPIVYTTNVSCYGRSDGSAFVLPTSGTPPFTYSWSTKPVMTSQTVTAIPAGTYTVSITDATGCTSHTPLTITQPGPTIIALADSSDPTTCNGKDGYITISGFDPLSPYTIRYLFNGTPVVVSLPSSSAGKITIATLCRGIYDSFSVVASKCPYNVVGPVTLTDPPIPPPPPVTPDRYCQFDIPTPVKATGSNLLWYGVGYAGVSKPPVPTTAAPGTTSFWVTQTVKGCVSDSSMVQVVVIPKPAPPVTVDTTYCQFQTAVSLVASGDSILWYQTESTPTAIIPEPVPSTDKPGVEMWYANQTIDGCPSDRTPVKVTVLSQPNFTITQEKPFVCQYDSAWFSYKGPSMTDPYYSWTIPDAERYSYDLNGFGISNAHDSMIYVRFDSVVENNYVHLFASAYHGRCYYETSVRMPVIPHPTAVTYTKRDVCAGDTVNLAIDAKSDNAALFEWRVDGDPLDASPALNIISHNSNSGGPFGISWNDSGRHVIQIWTSTKEGCKAPPTDDTINVHRIPDATFTYTTKASQLCLEDSVLFSAVTNNYNYAYYWSPEHYFANINKANTWGKVENNRSFVTLKVTDPIGCYATTTQELDPSSCCTVGIPSMFTPNGDGKNDFFRPIFVGFHRFHTFRIANRWGQTVYEGSHSNMQWDGTYNGVPQDMGVYFYYLKYDCGGQEIEKKGDVTLVR